MPVGPVRTAKDSKEGRVVYCGASDNGSEAFWSVAGFSFSSAAANRQGFNRFPGDIAQALTGIGAQFVEVHL